MDAYSGTISMLFFFVVFVVFFKLSYTSKKEL